MQPFRSSHQVLSWAQHGHPEILLQDNLLVVKVRAFVPQMQGYGRPFAQEIAQQFPDLS